MSYTPLNADRNEIRILNILPCECLCVNVHVASLGDEDVRYHALSYCWGDATDNRLMTMNGGPLTITASLYNALVELRASDCPSIWADAICINQADLAERAKQVRIMDVIYKKAATVIIWLGRADDQTAEIANILEQLGSGQNMYQLQWLHGGPMDFIDVCHLATSCISRPWFSRLWVWQERLLARNCIWRCGAFRLQCTGMSEYLAKAAQTPEAVVWWSTGDPSEKVAKELILENLITLTLQRELLLGREDFETSQMSTLDLLWNSSGALCSDPRDKVFGMMGIIPALKGIQVDYLSPVHEVYVDATKEITRRIESLDLLFLAGASPKRQQFSQHLPSWASSFDQTRVDRPWTYNLWLHSEEFCCAAALPFSAPSRDPKAKLHLRGHFVAILSEIGPTWPHWNDTHPIALALNTADPAQYLKLVGKWWDDQLTAWGRVFHLSPTADALWDVLLFGIEEKTTDGIWRRLTVADHASRRQRHEESRARSEDGTLRGEDLSLPELGTQWVKPSGARPFRTDDGYVGATGTEAAAPGDQIWLLAGSRVPYLLRPVPDRQEADHFTLIGACYVYSVMDGQLVPSQAHEDGESEHSGAASVLEDFLTDVYLI